METNTYAAAILEEVQCANPAIAHDLFTVQDLGDRAILVILMNEQTQYFGTVEFWALLEIDLPSADGRNYWSSLEVANRMFLERQFARLQVWAAGEGLGGAIAILLSEREDLFDYDPRMVGEFL
jgi:hypothetical protein